MPPSAVCRPPRCRYTPSKLGPSTFRIADKARMVGGIGLELRSFVFCPACLLTVTARLNALALQGHGRREDLVLQNPRGQSLQMPVCIRSMLGFGQPFQLHAGARCSSQSLTRASRRIGSNVLLACVGLKSSGELVIKGPALCCLS